MGRGWDGSVSCRRELRNSLTDTAQRFGAPQDTTQFHRSAGRNCPAGQGNAQRPQDGPELDSLPHSQAGESGVQGVVGPNGQSL